MPGVLIARALLDAAMAACRACIVPGVDEEFVGGAGPIVSASSWVGGVPGSVEGEGVRNGGVAV